MKNPEKRHTGKISEKQLEAQQEQKLDEDKSSELQEENNEQSEEETEEVIEYKSIKELVKEHLKNEEQIIEIGIGRNPALYNDIKKSGFKNEYTGVNLEDTMGGIHPKGLKYEKGDALDAERINEIIGDKEVAIVSNNVLFQIIQEQEKVKKERPRVGQTPIAAMEKGIEEAADAFNQMNADKVIHFRPTKLILQDFDEGTYNILLERFKEAMEKRGWEATYLREMDTEKEEAKKAKKGEEYESNLGLAILLERKKGEEEEIGKAREKAEKSYGNSEE